MYMELFDQSRKLTILNNMYKNGNAGIMKGAEGVSHFVTNVAEYELYIFT